MIGLTLLFILDTEPHRTLTPSLHTCPEWSKAVGARDVLIDQNFTQLTVNVLSQGGTDPSKACSLSLVQWALPPHLCE